MDSLASAIRQGERLAESLQSAPMSKRVTHLLEEFGEAAQHAHGLVGAGRVARSSKKIARQPVNAANCRRLAADMTETPAAHAPATPRDPPPPADARPRRWPGRMLSPHLPPALPGRPSLTGSRPLPVVTTRAPLPVGLCGPALRPPFFPWAGGEQQPGRAQLLHAGAPAGRTGPEA
jgi:hypothetical protein